VWEVRLSPEADATLTALERDPSQAARLKSVRSALGKMEHDLRHPGLCTHEFKGAKCPHGDKLFEAYAQNKTPGAFRIFWCYLPKPTVGVVYIVSITSHP
jgi:hypothetical protein